MLGICYMCMWIIPHHGSMYVSVYGMSTSLYMYLYADMLVVFVCLLFLTIIPPVLISCILCCLLWFMSYCVMSWVQDLTASHCMCATSPTDIRIGSFRVSLFFVILHFETQA